MDTFKSLLVALDLSEGAGENLSPESQSALAFAKWVAEAGDASVCLATVVPDAAPEIVELAEFRLKSLAEEHFGGRATSVHVSTGAIFIDLVRKVLADGHDLLVVGPRAQERRHSGVVGSTARRLVRKAPCPVLVAPRDHTGGPSRVLSSIAMDSATDNILDISSRLCRKADAAWSVMHVPEYPAEGGMRLRNAPEDELQAYRKDIREAAWSEVHQIVDPVSASTGVKPKLYMSEGIPSEQVLEAADELDVDLVVMGTIARYGLAGLLLGSTAEKLVDGIEVGLMVIKPDGFVSPVTLD